MFCLDTSVIIEMFSSTDKGVKILSELGESRYCLSSIAVYELYLGIKESERERLKVLIRKVEIISFGGDSALIAANVEKELSKKGKKINERDVLIAGICLANNLTIVSCDKDFLKVPDLKVKFF